jgi:hypothetical protein
MFRRIAALVFIFACASIAWAILGSTIFVRTYNLDPGLREKVQSSWGLHSKAERTVGELFLSSS